MKIKKLLLSICMICLAVLVMGGATVPAMQFGVQAMSLRTAGEYNALLEPKELFTSKGNYNVDMDYLKTALTDGQVFNFFGHDWRLVFLNEKQNVATFWMADPFTVSTYNETTRSGTKLIVNEDGSTNIWANGYTNSVWKSEDGDVLMNQSKVRELLIEKSEEIINNKAYSKYKNKIVAGYVADTNEFGTEKLINNVYYSKEFVGDKKLGGNPTSIIAKYGLGTSDLLWLPSYQELTEIWKVHENILQWTNTTNNYGYAWLRSVYGINTNLYANCVCASKDEDIDDDGTIDLFTGRAIDQKAGVRPAIHLDITDLTATNNSKGGWFNEDWLKTLFIVVCVLGIVGIGLVITAVVLKSRQKQAK